MYRLRGGLTGTRRGQLSHVEVSLPSTRNLCGINYLIGQRCHESHRRALRHKGKLDRHTFPATIIFQLVFS